MSRNIDCPKCHRWLYKHFDSWVIWNCAETDSEKYAGNLLMESYKKQMDECDC